MVRVKRTGEETEVDRNVMMLLRIEEKYIRRSYTTHNSDTDDCEGIVNNNLSLDALPDDDVMTSAWLADPKELSKEVMIKLMSDEFEKLLTSREKEVYDFCVLMEGSQSEFAANSKLSISRVSKIMRSIRKKAKNFF